jgi:hypothetical protein
MLVAICLTSGGERCTGRHPLPLSGASISKLTKTFIPSDPSTIWMNTMTNIRQLSIANYFLNVVKAEFSPDRFALGTWQRFIKNMDHADPLIIAAARETCPEKH